jgi:hypothetical protein
MAGFPVDDNLVSQDIFGLTDNTAKYSRQFVGLEASHLNSHYFGVTRCADSLAILSSADA